MNISHKEIYWRYLSLIELYGAPKNTSQFLFFNIHIISYNPRIYAHYYNLRSNFPPKVNSSQLKF